MSRRDNLDAIPFNDYADAAPGGQLRLADDDEAARDDFQARRDACVCVDHSDGSVTTMLCPVHAVADPCLTMASITGRRRTGTILRGVCTSCGHGAS